MNRKQLATLLVLVVVLGGAGLVVYRRRNAAWEQGNAAIGQKLLGKFPINNITRIAIRQGTNEVNLVKQDDLWRVRERDDYPASFSQISRFLIKAQGLKVVQSLPVGPSQLSRFNLAPPGKGAHSALAVEFYEGSKKPMDTLLVGKPHMQKPAHPSPYGGGESYPDGRYVKLGNSKDVAVISDPLESVETSPESWLDKDFFKVQKAKTIEVSYPDATNSWKLTRATEAGKWTLADAKPGEKLDSSKISGVTDPFSFPSFVDVWPGDKPAELGTNQPTVVKIATFDHFNYTVKVGQKTNDDYPITVAVSADLPQARTPGKKEKPAEKAKLDQAFEAQHEKLEKKLKQEQSYGKWTYLVSSWSVDPVLKDRSQLLAVKKPATRKTAKVSTSGTPEAGGVQTAKVQPVATKTSTADSPGITTAKK